MRRSESPFMPGNGVQDKLAVVLPSHHGLLQQPQQVPGHDCVEALLGHLLDQGALLGNPLLALDKMPIRGDQVIAFPLESGHGDTPSTMQAGAHLLSATGAYGFGLASDGAIIHLWRR